MYNTGCNVRGVILAMLNTLKTKTVVYVTIQSHRANGWGCCCTLIVFF